MKPLRSAILSAKQDGDRTTISGFVTDQVAFPNGPLANISSTSSPSEGHPDKIADQVSDSVLDAVLDGDVGGRVACETLVTTGLVIVAGEITT